MRILIPVFSPPTGALGPHTRTLALGCKASEFGHDVAFCAIKKNQHVITQQNFKVYTVPEPTFLGLPKHLSRFIGKRIGRQTLPIRSGKSVGSIWLVLFLTGMAKPGYLEDLVGTQLEAVKDFKPNAIFTELDPSAYLVSEITGIPLITTFASVAHKGIGSFAYRKMSKRANQILTSYGKKAKPLSELCFGSKILKIIPSIPELDGADPSRPDVRYVGHLLKNTKRLDSRPVGLALQKKYVFAYFGTGSVRFDIVKRVLPQVFDNNSLYHCIVASEEVHSKCTIGSVTFVNYIPAHNLLPYCAWTICHGGHNTIVQSILNKVPLIIFPGAVFERRFNARMVEESGCGVMGEISDFSKGWIENKLHTQHKFSKKVELLYQKFTSYDGAKTAIKAIEEFCLKNNSLGTIS